MEAATTLQPTAAHLRRDYIDFEPTHDLLQEEEIDTHVIHLAGFKKEQLKVQVIKNGKLITTGESFLAGNRWSRFRKEFPLPKNCKVDEIRARFDKGLLYIMLPKSVVENGKDELTKTTNSHKVEGEGREDTNLMQRKRSNIRKASEEEKEKEREKEKDKEKEPEKVANKNKDKKDHKEKGGTQSDAGSSFTERIRRKMGGMDFEMYLQPKMLMVGLALATVVSVGWYLHYRMTSIPVSGEQHPNI